jgi:hypothetical protein
MTATAKSPVQKRERSKKMRLGKRHAVFAAAIGITAALAATSPAIAATSHDSKMVGNSHANAKFYANGDKIVVCDPKADGYYALASFWDDTSGTLLKTVTAKGAGKCTTYSKNLPEGTPVHFQLYYTTGDGSSGNPVGDGYGAA